MTDVPAAEPPAPLPPARETLGERLGERTRWAPVSPPTEAERELRRRCVDAHERPDPAGLPALLLEDARLAMPPIPAWFAGRDAIVAASAQGLRAAARRRHALQPPARDRLVPAASGGPGPSPASPSRSRRPA
jgi:RNA polymerase sigma-70 factor (ECF subfamily)